jgi:hypothetical protein
MTLSDTAVLSASRAGMLFCYHSYFEWEPLKVETHGCRRESTDGLRAAQAYDRLTGKRAAVWRRHFAAGAPLLARLVNPTSAFRDERPTMSESLAVSPRQLVPLCSSLRCLRCPAGNAGDDRLSLETVAHEVWKAATPACSSPYPCLHLQLTTARPLWWLSAHHMPLPHPSPSPPAVAGRRCLRLLPTVPHPFVLASAASLSLPSSAGS